MASVYARPAEKLAFIKREERDAIFSNIEAITQCNEALLQALQKGGDPVAVRGRTAPRAKLEGPTDRPPSRPMVSDV
eukprot:3062234-Prymnesium_polylepis.1